MALFVILVRLVFHLLFTNFNVESAAANLLDGLWLVLIIMITGLVNVLVDFRKMLARWGAANSPMLQAVALSLALIPEVVETLDRIRFAVNLRAKRKGLMMVRAILVPLFAASIDRAFELTSSIAQRKHTGKLAENLVTISGGSIGYSPTQNVLGHVNLELTPGQLLLITGPTGSGKSSLLKLIHCKYPQAALVSQIPKYSFVAETVLGELTVANPDEAKLHEVTTALGLSDKLTQDPTQLSAGWQQRVAIAAALVSGSNLLLMDEPFAALDESGIKALQTTLGSLKQLGAMVVVAEHRSELLENLADRNLQVADGTVTAGSFSPISPKAPTTVSADVTVIHGENGSGKTTYLKSLVRNEVVLVPQPASDILFLGSVKEELRRADLDASVQSGTSEEVFMRFAPDVNLEQNPQELSTGQKLALALSIQLVKPVKTILLDEPTLGFDELSKQRLIDTVASLPENLKVVIATHDEHLGPALNARITRMVGGVPFAN